MYPSYTQINGNDILLQKKKNDTTLDLTWKMFGDFVVQSSLVCCGQKCP